MPRNRTKGACADCGKPIERKSTRCKRCDGKHRVAQRGGTMLDKVIVSLPIAGSAGCFEWPGHKSHDGYGKAHIGAPGGVGRLAHRAVYTLVVGPIPDGMTIDHICRNRACVNPAHLQIMAPEENNAQGRATRREQQLAATHCKHGHEWTSENTGYKKSGSGRYCKACNKRHSKIQDEKRRQRLLAARLNRRVDADTAEPSEA